MFFKQKFDFCWWLWQQHLLTKPRFRRIPPLSSCAWAQCVYARGQFTTCSYTYNLYSYCIRFYVYVLIYTFYTCALHTPHIHSIYTFYIYLIYTSYIYVLRIYISIYLRCGPLYFLLLSYLLYLPLLITLLKLHSISIYLLYFPTKPTLSLYNLLLLNTPSIYIQF